MARRQGMMVRLQQRRNELARKFQEDVLGVSADCEGPVHGGLSADIGQYHQDLQGEDAHADMTVPNSARIVSQKGKQTYPMACAMSKKQHDDHYVVLNVVRLAELGWSKLRLLQEQHCAGPAVRRPS